MIEAGAVEDVRCIVALHVDPELSVGRIGHRSGVLTAACQEVRIVIRGVGGHAARPHLAVDPIAASALLVSSLYQVLPRSVDSRDPSVVTFGSIRGGTSPNIIPDEVELNGTIRTLSDRAAAQVEERITQVARGLAVATRCEIDVDIPTGHGGRLQRSRGHLGLRPGRPPGRRGRRMSRRSGCPAWAARISRAISSMSRAACCGWAWRRWTARVIRCIPPTSTSMRAR